MIDKKRGVELAHEFRGQYSGTKHLHFVVEDQPHKVYGEAGKNALKDIKGAYHAQKGIITLFSDNAKNEQDFIQTMRHEALGHYALNTLQPQEKAALLQSISSSRQNPEMIHEWAKVDKHYPELSESKKAEEIYAFAAEKQYLPEIVPPSMRGGYQFDAKPINEQQLRILTKAISKGIEHNERPQQTFPQLDDAQFQKKSFVKKDSSPKKPFHEQVAEKLIQQLKEGTAPWQIPWNKNNSLPYNASTGAEYKGGNSLWLNMQNRADPRWMTYKQAQDNNAQVRKGEKGTVIQYWKFHEEKIKKDANNKPVKDSQGKTIKTSVKLESPKVFSATVFNAEQIEGLPELKKPELKWKPNERAEKILANSGVKFEHQLQNRAYYNIDTDSIHLPSKEQFPNQERYYTTALHELAHATGAPHRLSRDMSGDKNSESYAREELRADIASHLVAKEVGVPNDSQQNTAYVKHWIKLLKDDPKEILRACRDAEKAFKLILSYEKEKAITTSGNELTYTPSLKKAEEFADNFKNIGDKERFLNAVQERLNQKPTLDEKSAIKTEEEAER